MKKFFISFLALGFGVAAIAAVKTTKAKPAGASLDQLRLQVAHAFADYDLDRVDDIVEKISKHSSSEASRLENRALTMRNMLERVENIQILDSLSVDSATFFTHYKLSPQAGELIADSDGMPYYSPQQGREIIAVSNDGNDSHLISVGILDDGTNQPAVDIVMEDKVPENDTAYPFMMQDGTTLYFAMRDADDGIGGWDIYMTRRDDEGGYFAPTNVGMPYNSPANDYMLAIDETSGLGWWATDRNADPGKVTIYVFAPNETRVNLDADLDDIIDRAKITDIGATRPADSKLLSRLDVLKTLSDADNVEEDDEDAEIYLSLGNGIVYTSLSQFKNQQAAAEMLSYLQESQKVDELKDELADLRGRYGDGDLTVAEQIRKAEVELEKAAPRLQKRLNNIIRLEQ